MKAKEIKNCAKYSGYFKCAVCVSENLAVLVEYLPKDNSARLSVDVIQVDDNGKVWIGLEHRYNNLLDYPTMYQFYIDWSRKTYDVLTYGDYDELVKDIRNIIECGYKVICHRNMMEDITADEMFGVAHIAADDKADMFFRYDNEDEEEEVDEEVDDAPFVADFTILLECAKDGLKTLSVADKAKVLNAYFEGQLSDNRVYNINDPMSMAQFERTFTAASENDKVRMIPTLCAFYSHTKYASSAAEFGYFLFDLDNRQEGDSVLSCIRPFEPDLLERNIVPIVNAMLDYSSENFGKYRIDLLTKGLRKVFDLDCIEDKQLTFKY
jgi:hypothetical protein